MSDATNSEARLESILDQVRVLKAKYDERAKVTGENFNVFSILDRESDEVKTHSAIIAELLNPHGSHSQGTLFLKLFLEKLLKDEIPKLKCGEDALSDEYLKEFEVGVEVSFEKKDESGKMKRSQIDLLIESDDVCIVIENKIYAEDQKRQLGRYYEYALDTGKEHSIIYLTLGGDEPGELTLYGGEGEPSEFYGENKIPPCRMLPKDTVVCLSYEKFINEWVDACIKEVARIPQIRETLHQYQMTVKKLTGQPINKRYVMALKNILLEDENYNLIPGLEVALSEAQTDLQTDLQCKFLSALKNHLETKNLRYEVYKKDLATTDVTSQCLTEDKLKAAIKECSVQSDIGLTFSFSENKNHEIMFRIACSPGGWLYYGFILFENEKRVEIDDSKRGEYPYLEHLKKYRIDDRWKEDPPNGWLAYKESKYPEINFKSVEGDKKHNLKRVEELVDEIAKICEVVKKIPE